MSGKESRGYKCVLANIDTISSSLRANSAVKAALIIKYQEKIWLDATTETLDETALVRLVLNRISVNAGQYDIFMEMLRDIAGADVIVDKLKETYTILGVSLPQIASAEPTQTIEGSEPHREDNLKDDDFMAKLAVMRAVDKEVKREFGQFLHHVSSLMEQMQVNLPDVKLTWSGYVEEMSEDARQASDITSFLFALRGQQGPYDYGNLSTLLILFCDEEGKKLVAEYEEKLERQLRPTVIPTQRNGKRFIVKVDGKLNQAKELDFRNTLTNLLKCSPKDIILEDIRHGCPNLTYIVPAEVAESIQARIPESEEELKKAKMLQLTLEDHILWMANSEAEKEVGLEVQKTEFVSGMEDCKLAVINNIMVELPGSETKVVVDERRKLLGHIDLRSHMQDLGHVGRCIQLAYHGMVAAGPDPECVKLQLEVLRLGYDVTRLCDKLAVTVSQFKSGSTMILTNLQVTYRSLLGGFEDIALETLSSVSDLAGQMAKAAKELYDSFNEEAHKVERVLEKTPNMEADKEVTTRQRETDETNLEIKTECGNELLKKAQEKEEAEQSYHECELKEDKAILNQDFGEEGDFFQKLANAFTSTFLGFSFGKSQQTKEKQYKAIKEKKVEALKLRMKREKEQLQDFQNITDLTVELQSCKEKAQFAKSSAKALHKAAAGLKLLATLMMKAALFWKQMQEHCKSHSDNTMKDKVKTAMNNYSDEKRLKLWTSKPFKIQAVHFYAGWVALDCICGEYMGSINKIQKEVYKYFQENPTQEEAKRNVASLAAKLQEDLQDAQRACAERYSEMQEELRMLTEEQIEHF